MKTTGQPRRGLGRILRPKSTRGGVAATCATPSRVRGPFPERKVAGAASSPRFRGTIISSSENELLDSTNCSKGTLSGHKRMFTTFSTNPSTPIPTNARVAAKPMYRTPTTATTPLPQARAQVQVAPVQMASAAVAAASNPLTNTTDDYERTLAISL